MSIESRRKSIMLQQEPTIYRMDLESAGGSAASTKEAALDGPRIDRRAFLRSAAMTSAFLTLLKFNQDSVRAASPYEMKVESDGPDFLRQLKDDVDGILKRWDSNVDSLGNAVRKVGVAIVNGIGDFLKSPTVQTVTGVVSIILSLVAFGFVAHWVVDRIRSPRVQQGIGTVALLLAAYSYFFAKTSPALPVTMAIVGIVAFANSRRTVIKEDPA
jgi:hypothetical protein